MRKTNLRSIDLNLLVVLQELLVRRHVSRAAEHLNMSQSAVSRALQRLREMFDDELLVRTKHGYDLSARALAVLPQLNQLLKSTELLISDLVFDPASSTETVRFYGTDPFIYTLLPPLFARLRQYAPHMAMEARSDPMDHFALLESGEVHFVFSAFEPHSSTDQLHRQAVEKMEFSIVMSADNPLAKEKLSMEKYLAANHGFISLTGKGTGLVEKNLIAGGHLRRSEHLNTVLYLSSFTSVAHFCEYSDVLFHLPKQFAKDIAERHKLVVRDSLPDMEAKYDNMYLYWHNRYHKNPMCTWIREQLELAKISNFS